MVVECTLEKPFKSVADMARHMDEILAKSDDYMEISCANDTERQGVFKREMDCMQALDFVACGYMELKNELKNNDDGTFTQITYYRIPRRKLMFFSMTRTDEKAGFERVDINRFIEGMTQNDVKCNEAGGDPYGFRESDHYKQLVAKYIG